MHQPTGRVVLVDGYGGRALASLEAGSPGEQLSVAEGGPGAFVLNDTTAEARAIDSVDLRLGTPFGLSALGAGRALSGVGQAGLVVVNPDDDEANVVPGDGEPISFTVQAGDVTQVAPDGAIWSLVDGDLVRTTSSATERTRLGLDSDACCCRSSATSRCWSTCQGGEPGWATAPGTRSTRPPTPARSSYRCPDHPTTAGGWAPTTTCGACPPAASTTPPPSPASASPAATSWPSQARLPLSYVAVPARWCGSTGAPARSSRINRCRSPLTPPWSSTLDLVWVDDVAGDFVWGVNPWGIQAIEKNAQGILVLGDDGDIVDSGEPGEGATGADDGVASEPEVREPDGNGIDDPPVAFDDPVTARSGASVPVQVTVNDYDPDGEAIAVSSVGVPGHGSVDIGTATTVVYTPEPGYVGVDEFEYTIVDGSGQTASASVIIELLAPGSTNKPPVGVADTADTGPGVPVVVDVLLNDVDPERDALRLGGFSPPQSVGQATLGEVTETIGPSGLPALRFAPTEGFEGTVVFTYRPIDAVEAVGEDIEVRVEVALRRRSQPSTRRAARRSPSTA